MDDATKLSGDSRDLIDRQNQQLSDYEAELGLLRRRLESFDADRDRDKKQIALLQDALNRTRAVSNVTLYALTSPDVYKAVITLHIYGTHC